MAFGLWAFGQILADFCSRPLSDKTHGVSPLLVQFGKLPHRFIRERAFRRDRELIESVHPVSERCFIAPSAEQPVAEYEGVASSAKLGHWPPEVAPTSRVVKYIPGIQIPKQAECLLLAFCFSSGISGGLLSRQSPQEHLRVFWHTSLLSCWVCRRVTAQRHGRSAG